MSREENAALSTGNQGVDRIVRSTLEAVAISLNEGLERHYKGDVG